MIIVDTRQATRQLANLTKQLSHSEFRQVTARAINHTMNKAKTAANRAIRERYKIPLSQAAKAMKLVRATSANPMGVLKASSGYTPFHHFQPSVTSTSGVTTVVTRSGALASKAKRTKRVKSTQMTIEIVKGQKKRVLGAFFLPGNTRGLVTARGKYASGTEFMWRHRRVNKGGADTPIDALKSVSVFKAITTQGAQNQIFKDVGPDYQARLLHEINRALPQG